MVFSASNDGQISVIDIKNKLYRKLPPRIKDPFSHSVLSISKKGNKLYSGHRNGNIKVWNTSDFQLEESITAHRKAVYEVIPTDRYLVSVSKDRSIRVQTLDSAAPAFIKQNAHDADIRSAHIYGEEFLITAAKKTLKIWTLPNLEPIGEFELPSIVGINELRMTKNKIYIGSNTSSKILVWTFSNDFRQKQHELILTGEHDHESIALLGNCILAGTTNGYIEIFNINSSYKALIDGHDKTNIVGLCQ